MKKVAALFAFCLLVGCGDVYITTATTVRTVDSPAQRAFPRGELVFACTTTAGLFYYLDNQIVVDGCGLVAMTAVTERGSYDSSSFGRVSIYQFMQGWDTYFTFYSGRGFRY